MFQKGMGCKSEVCRHGISCAVNRTGCKTECGSVKDVAFGAREMEGVAVLNRTRVARNVIEYV